MSRKNNLSQTTRIDGATLERMRPIHGEGWAAFTLTLPPQFPMRVEVLRKDAVTVVASHVLRVLSTHDPQFQRWQDSRRSNSKWCERRDQIADDIRADVEAALHASG